MRQVSGPVLRTIILVVAAGCGPAAGGAVGRAGPPSRPVAGGPNARDGGGRPDGMRSGGAASAGHASGGGSPSDLAGSMSVPPGLQSLLVQVSVFEKAGRFRRAGLICERVAAALPKGHPGAFRLFVRSSMLHERGRDLLSAYRVMDRARQYATLGFERLYAVRRMVGLVRRMGATKQVVRLHSHLGRGMGAALLAPLVVAYWSERSRPDKAAAVARASLRGRRSAAALLGNDSSEASGRIGLLVSLSGRFRRAGLSVMRGALLALPSRGRQKADMVQGPGLQIWIEPVDQDPAEAVKRMRALGGVCAAVGPVWPARARTAAKAALAEGMALITLSPDPSVAALGEGVFGYLPDTGSRLASLVGALETQVRCLRLERAASRRRLRRRSRRRKIRRCRKHWCGRRLDGPVGLLVPEGPYGQALASRIVASRKARIEVVTYRRGQTTFSDVAAALKKKHLSALAAVMSWHALELFAPQMAAAGLWLGKGPAGSKSILFGALADGVEPKRLGASQRYLQGSLLIPGFYADERDPRWGGFVSDYRRSYGKDPDLLSAHAYEAASIAIRACAARNRRTAAAFISGLTIRGRRVFGPKGGLARRSALYRVTDKGLALWKHPACRAGGRRGRRRPWPRRR